MKLLKFLPVASTWYLKVCAPLGLRCASTTDQKTVVELRDSGLHEIYLLNSLAKTTFTKEGPSLQVFGCKKVIGKTSGPLLFVFGHCVSKTRLFGLPLKSGELNNVIYGLMESANAPCW